MYSARASVVFLAPGKVLIAQTDDTVAPYLVNFAAMVRLALPPEDQGTIDKASFGGSLVGAGVVRGYTVILPNAGGQWSSYYKDPILSVEAVDTNPQNAEAQARALIDQIDAASSELQVRLGIASDARVTTSAASTEVEVLDGGATSSTRLRGTVALLGLGVFVSAFTAVKIDRSVLRTPKMREGGGVAFSLPRLFGGRKS